MVKRSLRASLSGVEQAKRAFAHTGWTQENLAGEVGLKTRQSIWRFFTGQPIERQVFLEICLILSLHWREIAVDPPADFPEPGAFGTKLNSQGTAQASVLDIDTLVQQVRSQRQDKIQDQCGTLQLLDVNHPVKIDDIYIDVNTLEEIPSQQWLELADLQRFTPKECDQSGLGDVSQTQIAGMKAVKIYSKLRVLGKPGAGKTTFLQYLAIGCNRGIFAVDRVPIFITLRDFADESRAAGEFSLLNYIREEFLTSGISEVAETLFREGRVLLLLDGLDEVLDQERRVVVNEIRRLSEKYQKNLFVVACRPATQAINLRRFTDVEIAPFSQDQIVAFAQKWFTTLTKTTIQAGHEQAVRFIETLDLAENMPFRRLAVTPLFLHLACWVFHHQGKFPTKRSEFYKQCLDLLLNRWDETRGIERDEIYRGFLLPQKLKLLSQVATLTFEQGDYFFGQEAVEQQIGDYIRDLPNAAIEPEELQLESEGILKAIELQHGLLAERVQGVFSFSYQIFQEYFTARKIVASHSLQASDRALERLVSHITEPRWREIFLLTVAMLRSADSLVQLMKQQIDAIVAHDPYLQDFLAWTSQNLATPPPAAIRWHFNPDQQQVLQRYYDANQLLLDCLNSNCEVTAAVRQQIETTLLLPRKELKEREWGSAF
ncbi:NACHT domain-containing protein [Phormidesmis priestleyi ULC007]|uniref:NACHT domain-containing protein n=1 Tax=Phormidesmis priestleyi ULC007 TaxID=1920490 RepID=A0A2T1DM82_9CYAN|nr:NACHT domain-containing NTPase [Phormidesmis priestleyi]PSB21586.1 NACHT domain-containing protein [Phormidesmis priestleyi ULC007]PZO54627.1 MAG: NACHT domain-containing protein [Phormidesmis priestleyi]